MTVRFSLAVLWCVGLVGPHALVGCGRQTQESAAEGAGQDGQRGGPNGTKTAVVDPHDLPLTEEQIQQLREQTAEFAEAVVRIGQLRDTVRAETEKGLPQNPFDVHQALDQVDLVLRWLPDIARNSGVPKQHWAAVNIAADNLRELFEQLHQNIDNRADPGYATVAKQIDQRVSELEAIAQVQSTDQ